MMTAPDQKCRVHIRWMISGDMTDVVDIENASFEYAWTKEDFRAALRKRNCIAMVAEKNEKVVGFMVYELYKSRLTLTNFAVSPLFRRMGVGSQMAEKLIAKLSAHRRTRIDLIVRDSNLPAQIFFRSHKFLAEEILRGHYQDSGEDGYIMAYTLPGCDSSDASADSDSDCDHDPPLNDESEAA